MQSASSNFSAAASGSGVVWTRPNLFADWAIDGYGPPGTIDDLSEVLGTGWSISHALDDGLPSDVHDQSGGDPLGQLSGPLASGQILPAAASLQADPTVCNASNGASAVASLTVAVHPNTTAGDMLLLAVGITSTTVTVTTPTGWTLIQGPVDKSTVLRTYLYARLVGTTDTTNTAYSAVTVAFSGTTTGSAMLVRTYATGRGTPTLQVEASSLTAETVSGTSHTAGPVTAAGAQVLLVSAGFRSLASGLTWTPDAADTELGEVIGTNATSNVDLMMAASAMVGAGTYTRTLTTSTSSANSAMALIAVSVTRYTPLTGNTQESAAAYFSPFNASSPVYGYDRDIAPMTLDQGLIDAGGQERVRLFTGVMADLPVAARTATIQGVSATNRLLQKLIQPPAIDGTREGLTGTWPVSYALHKAGLALSPPPRAGCRWWAPVHGSLHPMIPDTNNVTSGTNATKGVAYFRDGTNAITRPTFDTGPYLLGAHGQVDISQSTNLLWWAINLDTGADLLSTANNTGRLEFWVRGDATDIAASAAGAGVVDRIAGMFLQHSAAFGTAKVRAGINTIRQIFITVDDGAGHSTTTLASGGSLPIDGLWHFIGFAWDVANQKVWLNRDGTITTATLTGAVTASLPTQDQLDRANGYPNFSSWLPTAEIHLTTGAPANPDNYPWVNANTYTWSVGATIRASQNTAMVALVEPAPLRAVDLIAKVAQSELASTRCDEADLFNYLPLSYWTEAAQQTQVDTLTTRNDIADVTIGNDLTRIRNTVALSYQATVVGGDAASIYTTTTVASLPIGTTTITCPLNAPAVNVDTSSAFTLLTTSAITTLPAVPFLSANTGPDGSGSAVTSGITARVSAWTPTQVTVTVTNASSNRCWLARSDGGPTLGLTGRPVAITTASVSARDPSADGPRGERAMTVTLPGIQDAAFANSIATALVGFFAQPRPRLSGLRVFGDPRRQPGDLVTITDPYGTQLSGLWRIMSINHSMNGATYEQTLTAVKAWLTGTWDSGTWNNILWST